MANKYFITKGNQYRTTEGYSPKAAAAKPYPTFEHAQRAMVKGERIQRGL